MRMVALDVYTPMRDEDMYYELYYGKTTGDDPSFDGGATTVGGTDDRHDGREAGLPRLDAFTFLTNGTIRSSSWIPPSSSSSSSSNDNNNVGELTRIYVNNNNDDDNKNLLLDGEVRYGIYLTLNSRNLLYARGGGGSSSSSSSLQYSWEEEEEEKEDENGDDNATTTTMTIPTTTIIDEGDEDEELMMSMNENEGTILASTSDLILYEGVAVMTYPYTNANRLTDFRLPRGFIGRIWYHRCDMDDDNNSSGSSSSSSSSSSTPTPTTAITTMEEETEEIEVVDDANAIKACITKTNEDAILPDIDDVSLRPFFIMDGDVVTDSSNVTSKPTMVDNGNNSAMNDSPTISPKPTTIIVDDDDDDDTYMRVYLILTFDGGPNVGLPNRILNNKLGETQAFTNIIMQFYTTMELLIVNEVELYNCDIWYQQHIPIDDNDNDDNDDDMMDNNDMNARLLQQQKEEQQLHKQKQHQNNTLEDSQTTVTNDEKPWYKQSSLSPPQSAGTTLEESQTTVMNDELPWYKSPSLPPSLPSPQSTAITMISGVSLEITIILSILYTPLPRLITQELLQTLMSSNKEQLLSSIQNETILAPYFFSNSLSSAAATTTTISSIRIVDNVTIAPTYRPTGSPTYYMPTVPPTREPAIINGWQFSLMVYIALSIFTLLYIIPRARERMRLARHVNDNVGTEYDNLLSMEAYGVIPPKTNNNNNITAALDNNDSSDKPKGRSSIRKTFRESMTLGIPTVLSRMDDDDNNNDHVNSNNDEDDNSNDQLVKQNKTIGGGQSAPATDVTGQQQQEVSRNAAASASGAATTMRKSIMGSLLRNVKYKSKKDPLGMDVSFIDGEEKNEMGHNDDDDDDDDDDDIKDQEEEESDDDEDDSHSNDEKGKRMKIQIKKNRFRD